MDLYPLRFEPIFKSMLWGGQRLPGFLRRPGLGDGPIGEAWVLSDVEGNSSRVEAGLLAGTTLGDLVRRVPAELLGKTQPANGRFPLLLKFIDARRELSVQVHPDDTRAAQTIPGASGKTEAWVILDRNPATSKIYAGFKAGVTADHFRTALARKTTPETLHSFTPEPGDCVFLEAGTVHAIGADILLFEVQQTSDITYRLYDWDRIDATTGQPRQLHVEAGLECSDFDRGPCEPVHAESRQSGGVRTEHLVRCKYFTLKRIQTMVEPLAGITSIPVGQAGECTAVVCVGGTGDLEWNGERYPFSTGDVYLLPASVGECRVEASHGVTLLECGIPR